MGRRNGILLEDRLYAFSAKNGIKVIEDEYHFYYVVHVIILFGKGILKHFVSYNDIILGGGPRVVVSTAAFHARVRGLVPGLGGLKETKLFLPHPRVKVSIVGSLRDREVACSASDRQGSNFEACVWRPCVVLYVSSA